MREKLGIVSLAQRRKYLDDNFAYKLLNKNIEDSVLLEVILTLNVSTFNPRNYVLILISHHTQNHSY